MSHDRVAVFLRGLQRTWSHIKPHTLYLFDQLFGVDRVDWYIEIWNTRDTQTVEYLKQGFDGRNVIFCESLPTDVYPLRHAQNLKYNPTLAHYKKWKGYNSGYWNIAYLDTLLISKKIEHELKNDFIYERVFFIRPDIYYRASNLGDIYSKPNEFEVKGLKYYSTEGNLSTDDLYYQTTSVTADILCSRFFDTNIEFRPNQMVTRCPHSLLGQYISRNYLIPTNHDDSIELIIVRPDVLSSVVNIAQVDSASCQSWFSLDNQSRIMHCELHGINPEEYSLE